MADIRKLISNLAAAEDRLRRTAFVAPWLPGARVRVCLDGLVCTFVPRGAVEGWGIYVAPEQAIYRAAAPAATVEAWLGRLPAVRLRLVHPMRGMSWLAHPVNEADMRQRFGRVEPVVVHLVDEAARFDAIVARFDGAAWWFEAVDRRADARDADRLQEALLAEPPLLSPWAGQTPEMRTAWGLAYRQMVPVEAVPEGAPAPTVTADGRRLRRALQLGGGDLESYREHGTHWLVEWRARDGMLHQSVIAHDLTVVNAGICLSGLDSTFDLQSLVNVIEGGG